MLQIQACVDDGNYCTRSVVPLVPSCLYIHHAPGKNGLLHRLDGLRALRRGKAGGRIHLSHSVQLFHLIRNAPRKGQRHGIDRRDIVPGLNALVLPSQPRNLLQHRFLLRQQLVMSRVSSAGKQERVPLQRNNDLHQLTVVMPGCLRFRLIGGGD